MDDFTAKRILEEADKPENQDPEIIKRKKEEALKHIRERAEKPPEK